MTSPGSHLLRSLCHPCEDVRAESCLAAHACNTKHHVITMSSYTKSSHHETIFEACPRRHTSNAQGALAQMSGEREHNADQDGGLVYDACCTMQLIKGLESMYSLI